MNNNHYHFNDEVDLSENASGVIVIFEGLKY